MKSYALTVALILSVSLYSYSQSAIDTDGSNDYGHATGVITGVTNNFTIECWVYPRSTSGFKWAATFGTNSIGIGVSNGILNYLVNNSSGNGTATVPIYRWSHIALVRNAGTYTMYLNGVAQTTGQLAAPSSNDGVLDISRLNGSEMWVGGIDELRIWNVARTATELLNNMNSSLSPQAGLAAYYKMDEGTPNGNNAAITQLTDASGNGKTATLNNFAKSGSTSNFIPDKAAPVINFRSGTDFNSSYDAGTGIRVLGRFSMKASAAGSSFSTATIKVNGLATGLSNFKLWESTDETFGTDAQIGSTVAAYPGSGSNLSFNGFSSNLSTTYKYYFLTASATGASTGVLVPSISSNTSLVTSGSIYSDISNSRVVKLQSAADFDGTNDNARASGVMTGVVNNFTLECWVNPRAYGSYNWALNIDVTSFGLGTSGASGTLTYLVNNSSAAAAGVTIPLNTWTHIALVRNNGTYILYKNGTAVTTPQMVAPSSNTGVFDIGRNGSGEMWNGAIDEVRVWSKVRSAAEIAQDYNRQVPLPSTNLEAYYSFDDGYPEANNSGVTSVFYDYSGNNRNATINNLSLNGTSSNFVTGYLLGFIFPVKWHSITVTAQQDNGLLNWKISEDLDDNVYQIECSRNSIQWENIGTVRGSKAGTRSYSYTHIKPGAGVLYYRVRCKETSGKEYLSSVVVLNMSKSNTYKVYPNPVTNGIVQVHLSNATQIRIFSVDGKVLYYKNCVAGIENINVSGFINGSYWLEMNGKLELIRVEKH